MEVVLHVYHAAEDVPGALLRRCGADGPVNVGYGAMTGGPPQRPPGGMPLSDTMSATQQAEHHGPTAAARSYGKLDFPAYTNGTLLNMWISQSG